MIKFSLPYEYIRLIISTIKHKIPFVKDGFSVGVSQFEIKYEVKTPLLNRYVAEDVCEFFKELNLR